VGEREEETETDRVGESKEETETGTVETETETVGEREREKEREETETGTVISDKAASPISLSLLKEIRRLLQILMAILVIEGDRAYSTFQFIKSNYQDIKRIKRSEDIPEVAVLGVLRKWISAVTFPRSVWDFDKLALPIADAFIEVKSMQKETEDETLLGAYRDLETCLQTVEEITLGYMEFISPNQSAYLQLLHTITELQELEWDLRDDVLASLNVLKRLFGETPFFSEPLRSREYSVLKRAYTKINSLLDEPGTNQRVLRFCDGRISDTIPCDADKSYSLDDLRDVQLCAYIQHDINHKNECDAICQYLNDITEMSANEGGYEKVVHLLTDMEKKQLKIRQEAESSRLNVADLEAQQGESAYIKYYNVARNAADELQDIRITLIIVRQYKGSTIKIEESEVEKVMQYASVWSGKSRRSERKAYDSYEEMVPQESDHIEDISKRVFFVEVEEEEDDQLGKNNQCEDERIESSTAFKDETDNLKKSRKNMRREKREDRNRKRDRISTRAIFVPGEVQEEEPVKDEIIPHDVCFLQKQMCDALGEQDHWMYQLISSYQHDKELRKDLNYFQSNRGVIQKDESVISKLKCLSREAVKLPTGRHKLYGKHLWYSRYLEKFPSQNSSTDT